MVKIARLNRLPEQDKSGAYKLLIPKSLLSKFKIAPETGFNSKGEQCITIDAPKTGTEASVRLMRSPLDRDPLFYIEVRDSRDLVQLFWDFIMINDPESPRFDTDVTPEGGDRWLNWKRRNHKEEKKALKAGLAPGQMRRGLRLTVELIDCLDEFCRALGFKSIALEALFYHNALLYEKHGFRYFSDENMMRNINEGFKINGPLYRRLDGSSFRQSWFHNSIRGRSWAIHAGILEEVWEQGFDPWKPPKMYRMVGKRFEVDTAPGVEY